MKEIELTQGKVALVDDGDFEWLSQWKWYAHLHHGIWYANRVTPRDANGKQRTIHMHRVIMNAQSGQEVDHKDGNGLNNQRRGPDGNLRFCTRSQNLANQGMRLGCSSRFKGVTRENQSWRARIQAHGKRHHLGLFDNEIPAALAYNEAATELFGEFARLNIVEEEI